MSTGPVPHVGGPILPPCSTNVLIGKLPAARLSDKAVCAAPAPDMIEKGSVTVLINNLPAARVGDMTVHQGVISPPGCLTVLIGG
ncbi:MAG TPA: PAAR domain-containing protein [Terriglobales bacterium]|nr:PAAR domain-containing protein [Terriglobales bacterium]